MNKAIKKKKNDNVATMMTTVKKGEIVTVLDEHNATVDLLEAIDTIPFGNKISLTNIVKGEEIYKCGYTIGEAIQKIERGNLVHVHNVKSNRINFPDSIIEEILKQMAI